MKQAPRSWRIDALDARAGLAFASLRTEWREHEPGQTSGQETEPQRVFLRAPDFHPDAVSNPALPLAAARASFQTGLFLEGGEASFPTLNALGAFVRRTYVSSGSGDGGEGEGPPTPPLPPGPDTPGREAGPRWSAEPSEAGRTWAHALGVFKKTSDGLGVGEAHETGSVWAVALDSSSGEVLARGAARILIEVFRRFPDAHWDTEAWLRWDGVVHPLLVLLSRMAVLLRLVQEPFDSALQQTYSQSFRAAWPSSNRWYETLHWSERYAVTSADAFSLMQRLPLPDPFPESVRPDAPSAASLFDFMVLTIGAPLATTPRDEEASLELLLLGAALLTFNAESTLTGRLGGGRPWHTDETGAAMRALVARSAWAWLRPQLPEQAFSAPVEEMIEKARLLGSRSLPRSQA